MSGLVFIIPVVVIVALVGAYSAADSLFLPVERADAVVTDRSFTRGGRVYNTNFPGQRANDIYMVTLLIDGKSVTTMVTEDRYEKLELNARVHLEYRRSRIRHQVRISRVG